MNTYTVTYEAGDAFRVYTSLTDLLSEGYEDQASVEIDNGRRVTKTTIGTLADYMRGTLPHYERGTATHRGTTAKLKAGDRVLTITDAHGAGVAFTKTGSEIRTVDRLEAFETAGGFHRRARRYNVRFTDGTEASNLAPVQSWHIIG